MERSTGEWKLIDRNHIDTSPLFKTFHPSEEQTLTRSPSAGCPTIWAMAPENTQGW